MSGGQDGKFAYRRRSTALSRGSWRVSNCRMLVRAAASGRVTSTSRSSLRQGRLAHGDRQTCSGQCDQAEQQLSTAWEQASWAAHEDAAAHLPARRSAGSTAFGRLVAATTRMWPGARAGPPAACPACKTGAAFSAAVPSSSVSSCPTMRASCWRAASLRGHSVSTCGQVRQRHCPLNTTLLFAETPPARAQCGPACLI